MESATSINNLEGMFQAGYEEPMIIEQTEPLQDVETLEDKSSESKKYKLQYNN